MGEGELVLKIIFEHARSIRRFLYLPVDFYHTYYFKWGDLGDIQGRIT